MTTINEQPKQTAAKIRKALKAAFPGIKFSVKTSVYSMGSSIDIKWEDGPFQAEVQTIANFYQSASFDGMTDYETVHGYEDPEDGKIYSGAKYIFASRSLSEGYREQLEAIAEDMFQDFSKWDVDYLRKIQTAERELLAI